MPNEREAKGFVCKLSVYPLCDSLKAAYRGCALHSAAALDWQPEMYFPPGTRLGKNDFIFSPPKGGKRCKAFLTR